MARVPEEDAADRDAGSVPSRRTKPRRTYLWVGPLSALPLALLAFAAWNSRWVRPGGDDWCFLPVVRDGGFPAMMDKFYFHDNGRVVNAVLVWAYARFDVAGQQWFAPVSGGVALLLLWAFVAAVLPAAGISVPRGVPLLVASMVMALFLFGSTDTYKTFYWPAASVSHTMPPIFACAAAIPLLRASSRRGGISAVLTIFVSAGLLSLLSEETGVVVLAVLGCVLLMSVSAFRDVPGGLLRWWCAAGIAGTVTGTLILYTSPGAAHRRELKHASSMLTPDSLKGSLRVFAHIVVTCLTAWPYLGALAVGVLLGLLTRRPTGRLAPGKREALLAGAGVCVLLASGYVCAVITYPVFGTGVLLRARLWNDYLLLYILFLVFMGTLAARAWRTRVRRAGPALAAGAGAYALICLALLSPLADLGSDMATRARNWDQQNRWMHSRVAAGARVLPYRRTPLRRMTEPFGRGPRVSTWPASCVATYYGLQRITLATKQP